jgi:hypothetical protein
MKMLFSILAGFAVLSAQAAEQNREFDSGRDYYAKADFKKAASVFQAACNTSNDAEACFWTGVSYERLADVRMPFGCRTDAKARQYLSKALNLAPHRREYRNTLFDFLLNASDCLRTGLREAGEMLSAMPESDPDYDFMHQRLESAKRFHGSAGARLAAMFLLIPREAYDLGSLPVSGLSLTPPRESFR